LKIRAIGRSERLWSYLKPYWRLQALTVLVMVILTVLALALPAAIQYMIDTLIPGLVKAGGQRAGYATVIGFGAVLLGIYLFNLLFSYLRDYLVAHVGAEIIKDIRLQLFAHLQRLSLNFHGRHQTGELMSRLLSDVGRLQDLLTVTFLMLFTNALLLAGILLYLLHTNWILTLIAIIPVPLTVYTTSRLGGRLNQLMATVQQRMADLSARLQEALVGIKTIKSLGQEHAEEERVRQILTGLNPLLVRASVTSSLGVNLAQFINMIGPVVVLTWGAYLVAGGAMKLGELMAFGLLLAYLYSPVRGLAETHIQVKSAMASADRIFEYLDVEPEIRESEAPTLLPKATGEIRFERVGFSYAGSRFCLEALSLSVSPCEKVALVGPSGAGKTTIFNLIMRFFDPHQGAVLLDGVDLRNLSTRTLRQHIALVEQDPLLFHMTIHDNIAYGCPGASDEEVVRASRAANIHDFILELPEGYQTVVGERGVTISGGERQRLCLARAMVRNPTVLLLDEATSALDATSEQLIQQSLAEVLRDKTAIIIAHRLATIQHADRILVLDAGRKVDEGTHSQLMDRCSLYRELANHQMLR
jgi:ATP-binding cassette, subfamily B, bacterial MsbA